MTTTTDTLTRWLDLWAQDETLRPEYLEYFIPADRGMWLLSWDEYGTRTIPAKLAAILIRDSAVRWLAKTPKNYSLHWWHEQWQVEGFDQLDLDAHPISRSPDPTDALYEACKAVLETTHE